MIFTAYADGVFDLDGRLVRCALGRNGVIGAIAKREGDGCSPGGVWPLRRVLYRPDRGEAPTTWLPSAPIAESDGWCDSPGDPAYNRPVPLPYRASAERLWRNDGLYDIVVILGHNHDPVVEGAGSAIFLHVAARDYGPTEGCVALARPDLDALLCVVGPNDVIAITDRKAGIQP